MVTLSARFTDLHDVAQVIAEHTRSATRMSNVQVGPPREVSATTEPAVRLTLLHTVPLQAPRNEPVSPASGPLPPPLGLTCVYLVSTSGTEGERPIAAHNALGQVLRLYHESPVLQLPLSTLGEGQLRLTQVASMLEQVAQIWLALRQPLQPCAVFEAGPIHLAGSQPRPPARHPTG